MARPAGHLLTVLSLPRETLLLSAPARAAGATPGSLQPCLLCPCSSWAAQHPVSSTQASLLTFSPATSIFLELLSCWAWLWCSVLMPCLPVALSRCRTSSCSGRAAGSWWQPRLSTGAAGWCGARRSGATTSQVLVQRRTRWWGRFVSRGSRLLQPDCDRTPQALRVPALCNISQVVVGSMWTWDRMLSSLPIPQYCWFSSQALAAHRTPLNVPFSGV